MKITLAYIILFISFMSPVVAGTNDGSVQNPPGQESSLDDPLGRSTPWGTLLGFMRAMDRQDYGRATEYLDTKQPAKQAEEIARLLQTVLDMRMSGDLGDVSRRPEGDLQDGLSQNREKVGVVKSDAKTFDIILERIQRGNDPAVWLFSSSTIKHLPEIRERLETPLAERYLPSALSQKRLLHLPVSRWIALILVMVLIIFVTWIAALALSPLLRYLVRRLTRDDSDLAVERIKNPFRLFIMALTVYAYVPLSYSALARLYWIRVGETLTVISLTWFCLRLIDILLEKAAKRQMNMASGSVAVTRLFGQLGKGLAILTGAAIILYYGGFNLTAVLTGLGVGGLAIAFAAQKTLENLFGGIMIVSDKAIRVGDFVRAGEHKGTVEDIGLRSTRIRTIDRTVVSVPNGQISTMSLENFALRDKIRFNHVIDLRYETSGDQLRYVLANVRSLLEEHPRVESASSRFRLTALRDSSFGMEVFAYILVTDWATYLEVQEDLLLRIINIVEKSGTTFAFPSRTMYLTNDAGLDQERSQAAVETMRAWLKQGGGPFSNYFNKSRQTAIGNGREKTGGEGSGS
jgi:MscS family membrane protein